MRAAALARLAALILFIPAAAQAECMSDDGGVEIAEGRLTVQRAEDAAGREERPYILKLASPACLDTADDDDRVESTMTIHVFSTDAAVQAKIAKLTGKSVLVRGKPFLAHTAHHHAPIVMDVAEIDEQ